MALTPDRALVAEKIAAHELSIALEDLVGATSGAGLAPTPELLPEDADLATAQANLDEIATLYRQRSAMLLGTDPEAGAFLLELEKGIVARLTAFRDSPAGRGGNDILAAAAGRLHPILLAARGAAQPPRPQ